MPSAKAALSLNASFKPTYRPVIFITGATSGIGESVTKLFASILNDNPHAKGAHFILVARNQPAAEEIISTLPQGPDFEYEFIKCDLTLMRSIAGLVKTLTEKVDKINFLVHSAGLFSLSNEVDLTAEGIHKMLASRYYSRFALTTGLIPLLKVAADERAEKASVLSILGAGTWQWVDLDDLGMRKKKEEGGRGYSGWRAMTQSIAYNDLMVAELASRYPSVAFSHIYPGTVVTPGLYTSFPSLIGRVAIFIFRPLIYLLGTSREDNAEYMLYALLAADKGMYRKNPNGDEIGSKGLASVAGRNAQKEVWYHSVEVIEAATKA